tara:strand:+ start:3544 stop:4167 length:624 start_codon:yes stop_codon:yes gene_type:complete
MLDSVLAKSIICADALKWLKTNQCEAIFTSPPDAEEIKQPLEAWEIWFKNAVSLCFRSATGPVVFYATDRKGNGRIYSKTALIFLAAIKCNAIPVWHKICLRKRVGNIDLHRPTFTHLLAFNGLPGKACPDVIERGKTIYKNGTGLVAARFGVEWIQKQADTITDPFCGQGTIPAVADALGMSAKGIDIDQIQCNKARALFLKDSAI